MEKQQNLFSDKVEPEQTLCKILNTHVPLAFLYWEGKCHLEELHQILFKKYWFWYRSSTLYFKYSYFKSCLKSHAHKDTYFINFSWAWSWTVLYTIMCCTKGWHSPHPCLWMTEPVKDSPVIPRHSHSHLAKCSSIGQWSWNQEEAHRCKQYINRFVRATKRDGEDLLQSCTTALLLDYFVRFRKRSYLC